MKIWFAFGDSITDMGYYIDTVCKDDNLMGVKYGFSGYALGEDPAGFGSLRDAVNTMLASGTVPDIVTVFGGTNDFGHGGSVPALEQGLDEILTKIRTKWPKAGILVITPLQRNFEVSPGSCEVAGIGPNQIGNDLIEYVDTIRKVAKQHNVPVLDLYQDSGITMANARQYTIDGLHPTPEYGITLGHKIAEAIRENFSEMLQ